jgi:uncharacterized repeat protein (TIGR01451 family)
LTNTGNNDDSYDFTSSASGDFSPTVSYFQDVDASGTLTAADVLLTDTDGDGNPNTGTLAPSESMTILVAYDVPAGVNNGDSAAISVTASSDFEPAANDFVVDTIDVVLPPELVVAKEVLTVADPYNMASNPKAIPGAEILYTVTVSNQGAGTVDNDTFSVTDLIPADGCMLLLDVAGPGSGPVDFQDGTPASGLSYSFTSLASTIDDLEFSNDDGLSFNYTPIPNGSGCDAAITHIRINPTGTFAADTGAGSPQASFAFGALIN